MSQADDDFNDAMWNCMDDTCDRGTEPVEIAFDSIEKETEAAWLMLIGGCGKWIPKSQAINVKMEKSKFGRRHGTLELPEWLVVEKGLV